MTEKIKIHFFSFKEAVSSLGLKMVIAIFWREHHCLPLNFNASLAEWKNIKYFIPWQDFQKVVDLSLLPEKNFSEDEVRENNTRIDEVAKGVEFDFNSV